MTIRCLLVDDEPLAREGLANYIQKVPFLELVGACSNAFEAIQQLESHPIDLLFLDIQMPDLNGIELAKAVRLLPAVIFTTAHREYAVEGFELNAVDYLLKPFSFDRFLKAVQKAKSQIHLPLEIPPLTPHLGAGDDHIFIKADGQLIRIQLHDILYIEANKDYIFIYTTTARYLTLLSLKQLEERLPAEQFLRVHRSFIVSLAKVSKIEGNLLHVHTHKVPISRSLAEEVHQKIVGNNLLERL